MASYKEKILEVIGESDVGLTTVDVAKKAGVSKTTVIKYLSVLSSEGLVEFVEVGPSKLWRNKRASPVREPETTAQLNVEALPMVDVDFSNGDEKTVYFSFRMDPDQICALLKRANKCMCNLADPC
ncbi:MAG TPA: winged helix-turn-helix domain-containing protein [Methanothrix sp.]|jgi:predicted ArsR family transcriptional regulator|nr:winged helix-turn-helix transcriptional regulator [Methanothrix sp.]HOV82366.1 winged helix-turn-helix domain-containing protein [Methanothrix sp.]HPC88785.1 winged helix-turn-helix domain-containing protein [Methanothrix sp.]HQE87075.1 winged helix-turn-helix domain-containing protein [Methanothrix sp.]HQI67459.1 winged helix-turn-helix domain-containing protein [Methanothrix sp.]